MKKQFRNLIISLCVVVLLIVGVIVGNKIVGGSSSSSSSESDSSSSTITVFKVASTDITKLHVKTSKDEYTINQANGKFSLEGLSNDILSQDTLSCAVSAAADIEASKLVEKGASDLSQYGLDKPAKYVDITTKDKIVTVNIGNETPLKDGTYLCLKGSSDVYKVESSTVISFEDSKTDYVNLSICGVDSSELANITTLEFAGTARSTPIVLVENTSSASSSTSSSSSTAPTYKMQSPYNYPLDSDKTTSVLEKLESLSASGVISLDVSDANLQKYGLKNPEYTFSATNKGVKMTLDFGKPYEENGTTYLPLVLEGTPVVYKIDSSLIEFYNYTLTDLCSTLLFTEYIDDVKSITVTKGSESYTINLAGTDDNLTGTYGSKKLETSNVRKFYQALVGIAIEGEASKPANASTYAKVVVTYRDNSRAATTLEFFSIDSRRSFWSIDGKGSFYVLNSSIDNLMTKTKDLIAGKTLTD